MLSIEKQVLYLLSRAGQIAVKDLVHIYEFRQYSGQYIRNVLFQLKKSGYVQSNIRSTYRITQLGKSFVESFNQKPMLFNQEWDGEWQFVLFEFPEQERKSREQLRSHLRQLGFGHLYNGVYISPWDYTSNLLTYIQARQIEPYVDVVKGARIIEGLSLERVKQIWALNELEHYYQEKWIWFQETFLPNLEPVFEKDDHQLFHLFLTLGDVISELGLIDPMLPKQLVPDGWQGSYIYERFVNCLNDIAGEIPKGAPYYQFVQI